MAKTASKGVKPVSYEEIAKSMLLGRSIHEQLEAFKIPDNKICDHRRARLLKIQRVYNVNAVVTGHACKDPDFIRLPVPQGEFKRIALILGEEEDRLKLKAAC